MMLLRAICSRSAKQLKSKRVVSVERISGGRGRRKKPTRYFIVEVNSGKRRAAAGKPRSLAARAEECGRRGGGGEGKYKYRVSFIECARRRDTGAGGPRRRLAGNFILSICFSSAHTSEICAATAHALGHFPSNQNKAIKTFHKSNYYITIIVTEFTFRK